MFGRLIMEYTIIGEPMPVVECKLNAGEAMKTEAGSMVWMGPNMKMATNTGVEYFVGNQC